MTKLYAVGNAKPNPSTNPYRDLAITVALTAAISTATTMTVQWLAGRARRSREREEAPPQQQMLMGFPGFGQTMMPQGYSQPMMPMQPGYGQPMMGPGGMMWLPQPPRFDQNPAMPQALAASSNPSRSRKAESGTEPAWFASFRKEQETWRRKLESNLVEVEDEDEEDVG